MAAKRHFPSFVDAFAELVLPKGAPPEFARWAALWCISAATERRTWTFTLRENLFPNIFAFLVAPAGFGKGLVIEPAVRIIEVLGEKRIGASSMTSASLADGLREGQRNIIDPKTQAATSYHALNILSPELQVLLPEYDTALLGKATNIYDAKAYSESRRGGEGKNTFRLPHVTITLLAGTTPVQIFSTVPESAFQTGFFSRVVLVWGTPEKGKKSLFYDEAGEKAVMKLEADLAHDLKVIAEVYGKFRWEGAAQALTDQFFNENYPYGGNPVPSHPRLLHYCTRRTQHLIKLMMLRALDLGTMDLTAEFYDWAFDTLIATEARMPEIFQEQNQGGETQTVNDLHHELVLHYAKTKKPVPRGYVYALFGSRVPSWKIEALLKMAVTGGWLLRLHDEKIGTCYVPRTVTPEETERKMK